MSRDIYQDNNSHRYDDIIDLEHPTSRTHPRMSVQERAAQFAPFAALTGHSAAISETARLTEERPELEPDYQEQLDWQVQQIRTRLEEHPQVEITYFIPDERKAGGSLVTVNGVVIGIDAQGGILRFSEEREIPLQDIVEINGELFDEPEC